MMSPIDLNAYVDSLENNRSIYKERNFENRVEVIDFINLYILDPLNFTEESPASTMNQNSLIQRAEKIKSGLESIDAKLFDKLRSNIRERHYNGTAFKNLIRPYIDITLEISNSSEQAEYTNLDIFINELFPIHNIPEQKRKLEPDMVHYQKTPAIVIFEMVDKIQFRKQDVFFDLGSGLGQAAILVHLLSGIAVRGIEFETAFCDYANHCVTELNLSNVLFENADARYTDYSEGTVFFMFTPFSGKMLTDVLELLRLQSLERKIKLISYGPCTMQVARESWLASSDPNNASIYTLRVFNSL